MSRNKKGRYLLNTRSSVIHVYPPLEQCNTDQIPRRYRRIIDDWSSSSWAMCKHCAYR